MRSRVKVRLLLFCNIVIILKADRDIFYLVTLFHINKPKCDLTDFEFQAELASLSTATDDLAFDATLSG